MDLNRLAMVVFVITIIAVATLAVQIRVLQLQEGTGGQGSGSGGSGNGTGGHGVGAGKGSDAKNIGYGESGVADEADKLGYAPNDGGRYGMTEPAMPEEVKPSSKPDDLGDGASGEAENVGIDLARLSYTSGGITMGTNKSGGGGGGGKPGPQLPQVEVPEKLKWLILIITAIAIGTAVAYLARSYMKARRDALRKAAKAREKGKGKKKISDAVAAAVADEFIETIEMTYDTLAKMGDVRKAITLCYSRMCGVIADKGLVRSPDVTPREFYTTVRNAFDTESRSMKALTMLFEEAVYSEHPMAKAHRDAALKLLKETVTEVKAW